MTMDHQENKKKKVPVWVWIVVCLVLAALIAVVIIFVAKGSVEEVPETTSEATEETSVEATEKPSASVSEETAAPAEPAEEGYGNNEVSALPSYSVLDTRPGSADMLAVVAVNQNGEDCLTNGELQIYYWLEFYSFISTYGQYAGMMGLDLNKPLAEQPSLAENLTWEQYFLSAAAKHYSQNYAMWQKAVAEGTELKEEDEKELADLNDPQGSFAEEAKKNGFDSSEAYVQANFGDGVSLEDYTHYLRCFYLATEYFAGQQKSFEAEITDDAVEAYFDEHADHYAEQKLQKLNDVAVRHILIAPKAEENAEPTEEAWTAAEKKANELYTQWQKNPTEDNFSAMATESTEDTGSKNSGGLYDAVVPGQMVPEFDAWCFDPARKAGDSGIVKSRFGYHIMYFVGQKDTAHWRDTVRNDMLGEKMTGLMEDLVKEYPVKFDFTKVRIFDLVSKNLPEG